MTHRISSDFRSWDPSKPYEKVPKGYKYFPPSWAWESIPGHPPMIAVPCITCSKRAEPYHRYEFVPEEDDSRDHKWDRGVGVFTYICIEHGEFVHETIERTANSTRRNGQVSVS